jgi:hypothetical protein
MLSLDLTTGEEKGIARAEHGKKDEGRPFVFQTTIFLGSPLMTNNNAFSIVVSSNRQRV